MSTTFDDLIRQPRQATVRKSRGGVIAEVPPWREGEHPFTPVVIAGLKARFAGEQRPEYKGEVILDRKPTFLDTVVARSRGADVRQRDAWDDWQEESTALNDIDLSDLAAWLSGDV